MSLEQKIQLSIIILLTGIVIVFSMLIFLTFVIKGYGAVVKTLQSNQEDHKDIQPVVSPSPSAFIPAAVQSVQTGISEETVAAISAAVYTLYGTSAGKVTSIRHAAQPNRSAWGMAGLLENTRPF